MAIAHSRESFYMLVQRFPHRKQILVEGDSWVGHPLPRATNLCVQINNYFRGRCNIFSLGEIGHLATDMMSGYSLRFFQDVLKASQYNFDLIFFSAGGNDILANDQPGLALTELLVSSSDNNPSSCINRGVWQLLLAGVLDAYKTLVSTVESLKPGCPIVTHTYDYIYPRNKGADILFNNVLGPWVYPAMRSKGIADPLLQRNIIRLLLDEFADALAELSRLQTTLKVVNTLGTLPQLQNWNTSIANWDDEIHPNKDGFSSLVNKRIGPVIKQLLN
ncbi:SGNH/GDSL hydrolase family protein [Rheinheimera maricola]|uniref:SGNH hydrolase-type esterase domain-containing protein n=1 Tax=Rheinheimera maricola TaxID=2793282 RepID=A0ABS7X6Z0_9GAMM|nr:SGNH/GDSL hydrolase family protein [Rheinheimera maricola]MBZ9611321.1 hypothetical protein [Rheinheimera maricola]